MIGALHTAAVGWVGGVGVCETRSRRPLPGRAQSDGAQPPPVRPDPPASWSHRSPHLRPAPQRIRDAALAALDPKKDEPLAILADGHTNAVAGLEAESVDLGGRDGDGHLLHGRHAERRDDLVADEDEVRRGAGDELSLDLVGGGPEDGAPQARGEGDEQPDEQER